MNTESKINLERNANDFKGGMHLRTVATWEEFQVELQALRKNAIGSLLFRGHENSEWPLKTTLERSEHQGMLLREYYQRILKVRPQIEAFTGNHWVIPTYSNVNKWSKDYDAISLRLSGGRLPGYDYMAYLRHHGFPSPLLDWTRSPYVAAFFAFNKSTETVGTQKVSLFIFEEAEYPSRSNRTPNIFRLGPYVRTHRRHFLQQSEYTLCIRFDDEWQFDTYDRAFEADGQGRLWQFVLPSAERIKVLKILDEYNLNAFSLLNSEESLVETMALREFHISDRRGT